MLFRWGVGWVAGFPGFRLSTECRLIPVIAGVCVLW